jgi:uncharacterized protein YukE
MGKVGYTESEVKSIVAKLEEEKTNLDGYTKKLNTELDKINEAWEGADATKYTLKMREDYSESLNNYINSFNSYIEFLSDVPAQYKSLDDKFAADKIEV